ncbi:MAG TPA: sigma-70 family RNA polymerase sigma factor, partial [Candidatus Methylacidiphilales bacterium]|nr:sigma-70 family RNA polymerase sigma factor [Candidatus Methylacidiphilales bacterium]
MTDVSAVHQEDFNLVQACLEGESAAFTTLRERSHGRLMSHLISRGASETEAGDLLADLWSECAMGREGRSPLFLKYHGKCSLYTWLVTVSLHRLVDLKRRQKFQATLPGHSEEDDVNNFDLLPGNSGAKTMEADLQAVMRKALKDTIEGTPAEQLILLQLVYLQGLMQREVARMYGWHESKVSRSIDQTMKDIEQRTLLRIKEIDPYLNITWQDFLDLCMGSEG